VLKADQLHQYIVPIRNFCNTTVYDKDTLVQAHLALGFHPERLCCKDYFEARKPCESISLSGELEEALDELRLAHRVISVGCVAKIIPEL
jgi:hypothetical protein